ncbi:VOC family protein [Hoyosella rhizosphaerae]|uniref:3-demethylubiquinone-9 3-methyltransferase n=1 Tax=Hoyosella rhizosphaerae TaxID=1755582 RepID=A0A916U3J1_9ACTN|nr:VOC family protein [Hoyosella rhizosphaerae]MBN4926572.1 VOC family protein [Hoyosella rhizosphaerae]GGC58197.1 putative 3-demethylubiquinone-9 3-methyltransferase [Hoyosella rhizosphaerae]
MPSISSPRIIPNLWFNTNGADAVDFYVSVFPHSRVTNTTYYTDAGPGPAGSVLTVDFELGDLKLTAINGGADFPFTEAISFLVLCANQEEVDYYWDMLTDGGSEVQCGWLKDKFGLSWQIVPEGMEKLLAGDDAEAATRAFNAMFGMKKIDLAALQAAYNRE